MTENDSYYLLEDGHEFDLELSKKSTYTSTAMFKFPTTGNIIPLIDEEFELQFESVYTVVCHFKQNGTKWVETRRLLKYPDGNIIDIGLKRKLDRVAALPTASASELSKTYLLTGTQTGYVKGGIYECQQTSNDTYEWKLTNLPVATVKDVVASSSDFADFQSKIALL